MVRYPGNRSFAFTILDDTDDTTVQNGKPVYRLLRELGFRTTKTVWAFDSPKDVVGPYYLGQTLQNPAYREWVDDLERQGFEIAFHNASMASSLRGRTEAAVDFLTDECGYDLRIHCNHGQNRENLFWGAQRYHSRAIRLVHALGRRNRKSVPSEGSSPDSPYYWADIAAERFSYIRGFAFRQLDCASVVPGRPYRDSSKSPSPLWFSTADAPRLSSFMRLVTRESVSRLADTGGWTIISTHLGKGFALDGTVDPEFESLLTWVAGQNGWFVPAGELLDHLAGEHGVDEIGSLSRTILECRHVLDRIRRRRELARYGQWHA